MNTLSIWHWLTLLIFMLIVLPPWIKIMGKAGYNKMWAILFLIPMVNIFALWIFAFSRWPGPDKGE